MPGEYRKKPTQLIVWGVGEVTMKLKKFFITKASLIAMLRCRCPGQVGVTSRAYPDF